MILDGQNGALISRAAMPDGKEIYMSVAVLPGSSPKQKNVVFGTGGETLPGNLFVSSISEIRSGDLSKAIKLDSSNTKGFVGPAAWVDINSDGIHDIVANAVDGRLLAFDGLSHQSIWKVEVPGTEAYSSVAIGNFNKDKIPDFFVSFGQGVWPDLNWSISPSMAASSISFNKGVNAPSLPVRPLPSRIFLATSFLKSSRLKSSIRCQFIKLYFDTLI